MSVREYVTKEGKKLFEVYVAGRDGRGQRIQWRRMGYETRREAEKEEFELKRKLAQIREEKVPFRFGEWFEVCLKQMKVDYQPSTLINYQTQIPKWILPKWKDVELRTITKMQIHQMIFEEIGNQVSPGTQKSLLKLIRRIFTLAVEEGHLERNPCTGIQVKVPEVEQKVLTNSEVEIFLREAKLRNHPLYPTWVLALTTGMRIGELLGLTWNDIDLEGRIISVNKQWNWMSGFLPTKSRRSRVVPISEDLVTFLKEEKLRRGNGDEFVIERLPTWQGGNQAHVTRDFCKEIGITSVKFHDLRATFITNLLSRGVPLAQVMAVVGHSQLKTTNGYLRKAGVEVRGVTDQLGYKTPVADFGAEILPFPKRGS